MEENKITAAALFTAIAVGIGNTHHVQLKQGWHESAIMFVALVGRPGANKSQTHSHRRKWKNCLDSKCLFAPIFMDCHWRKEWLF